MTMPKAKKPKTQPPHVPLNMTIETFNDPKWALSNLTPDRGPSCYNSRVSIRRYKITVQEIEEPVDVLVARCVELWEKSDNHHDREPLKNAVSRLGLDPKVVLPWDSFGSKAPRKHY